MKCGKCGGTEIIVQLDDAGYPNAYCATCGQHIKRMNAAEAAEYYIPAVEAAIALKEDTPKEEQPAPKRMPCRYCTEHYVMEIRTPSQRITHTPIEAVYCPMCGRKLEPEDRAY